MTTPTATTPTATTPAATTPDLTTPDLSTSRRVFPVLDTLRAVGAIAVLTTHTAFWSTAYGGGSGTWGTALARLDVGVAIFFVLSGFLLSRPYLVAAAEQAPLPATARYYGRRFLRIYPLYAVTVVVALLLVPQVEQVGVGQWLESLLMLDIYTSDMLPQGITQMWSLAVEVSFYLVLPWVMRLALRGPRHRLPLRLAAVLALGAAASVVWHLGVATRLDAALPHRMVTSWLPGYLTWFVVGIALAAVHVAGERSPDARVPRALRTLGEMPGVCWTAVAGLMLVASTPLAGPTLLFVQTPAESLTKHVLYACVGGLVVVTGVHASPHGGYGRVMAARPLRHLGLVSYGVFCIHLPVLHLVMVLTGSRLFDANPWQVWFLTLALSLAAADVLYRLVERPAMGLTSPASAAAQANSTT